MTFPVPHTHHVHHRLSHILLRLISTASQGQITLGELAESLYGPSNGLLSLLFAFPFILPVPVPGLSVLFGLVIALAGAAAIFHQRPWIPAKWKARVLPSQMLIKILKAAMKMALKLEKLVRPRGLFVVRFPWIRSLCALLIAIQGLLLALPLPPGTNWPPASSIIFLSIGQLERDGLFLSLGLIASGLNFYLFYKLFSAGFSLFS